MTTREHIIRKDIGPGRTQYHLVIEAVAIDGPVASGKSSVGARVAERLNYAFLDTGIMYRAATWKAIRSGVDVHDEVGLTSMTESMRILLSHSKLGDRLTVDGADVTDYLRTVEIDRNVSAVSAVEGVRLALTPEMRHIAESGPIVMVGRDIGTVVLTDARTKVYLDASVDVRAARRHAQMLASGSVVEFEQVLDATMTRDRIDSERAVTPLSVADDAVIIDTDGLLLDEVVNQIVKLVERR